MDLFDADILIGRAIDQDQDAAPTIDDVIAELDRTGVARALVTTTKMLHSQVDWGNLELLESIKDRPRIKPILGTWGIVDRIGQDDMPTSVDKAVKAGAAGFQLWTKEFALAFAPWQLADLLPAMADRGLPLFMHIDQGDFNGVHDVMKAYPKLRLVLQRVTYGETRKMLALMKLHPNLHLCISPGFVGGSVLEQFDRFVGIDRLMFGSGLFKYDQLPAVAQISYCTLSHEKKAMIASGNLTRLLEGIR
jgi:predicted TIM-barrel fold metal-dependent hydrolase